jgi:hypothetical protein
MDKVFVQGRWGVSGEPRNGAHGVTRATIAGWRCVRRESQDWVSQTCRIWLGSFTPVQSALRPSLFANPFRNFPSCSNPIVRRCAFAQSGQCEKDRGNHESLTHSLPLFRPSRACGFAHIPFAASQAAQVANNENHTVKIAECGVRNAECDSPASGFDATSCGVLGKAVIRQELGFPSLMQMVSRGREGCYRNGHRGIRAFSGSRGRRQVRKITSILPGNCGVHKICKFEPVAFTLFTVHGPKLGVGVRVCSGICAYVRICADMCGYVRIFWKKVADWAGRAGPLKEVDCE